MEIFKDIPEFENKYQASTKGRIKSLGNNKGKKDKILKASFNSKGYLTVALYTSGVRKTFTVHQLVAITFLNHKLNGYALIVDHRDDDKANNHVENLKIISQRSNVSKPFGKNTGIKKAGLTWNVTLTFCSFETIEEAYTFRKTLLNQANKLRNLKEE